METTTTEPTPEQIAHAIESVSRAIRNLKDSGMLTDETIVLANEVAQAFLTRVKLKIETDKWDEQESIVTPDPIDPLIP